MEAAAVVALILIGVLFLGNSALIAKGMYDFASTQPVDEAARQRYRRFLLWMTGLFAIIAVVGLLIIPDKLEYLFAVSMTFLLFAALFGLQHAARTGKIGKRAYLIARVSLIPVFVLVAILLSRYL